ncbi:hypothetical protein ZHAS_00015847 [Anopheles sinensis]|uniref:Transcription factor Adf-1 n=1 Tax=Anopheles sinensis TaxID=74873 RepID=A0A084WC32_ANOSI|nr:hypothetical protein ZHAS_00015847 [Anopheles sinensis]
MQKINFFTMAADANGSGVVTETLGKRQFVKVNESVFVSEIKKRPILYDFMHKDYKRITLRNEAWKAVAVAVKLSVPECKKRWRSMRDAFLKNMRNKGEEERKSWVHYRLLEFLLPFNRTGFAKQRHKSSVDYGEYNENSNDFDYLGLDNELDLYGDEPVTVSYVTEDGKELFQIHHRPIDSELPESVVGEDDEEEQDDLDGTDTEGALPTSLLRPQHGPPLAEEFHGQNGEQPVPPNDEGYLITSEEEDVSEPESMLYEERLDSTILDLYNREAAESTDGEVWKKMSETVQEAPEECYDSVAETIEPADQRHLRRARKRPTALEPDVDRSVKVEKGESHFVSEPSPLASPKSVSAPPLPATPPAPSSPPQREEESRSQGGKEMDARLGITDPDERFLMSCAPILRRLPNKKNLIARLRIQQLLYELEYDEKYDSGT